MDRACSTNGEKNSYRILMRKPERKKPLGRPRCREIGWGVLDWTDLTQGRNQRRVLVNAIINLQVP
jgi:hypothetical protein